MDVTALTLTELAAAYRDGRLRPTEAVEAYLARIEPGPVFRVVTADRARSQAERAERLLADGTDLGRLQGVPIALKDLVDTEGETTAAGSRVLAERPPARADAVVAARLDAAGAVFLGKTNMTELAFSGIGINPHFGTPGCALDAERVPGGSSSGSGVAVAAGLACAAIGSDTGGSVRIPAAFNGIVGLKTTDGDLPTAGCVPLSPTLDTIGPLARTVEDAWHLWRALKASPSKPFPEDPPAGLSFLAPTTLLLDDLEPAVERAFDRACADLERLGHRVTRRPMPMIDEIPRLYARHGTFAGLEALALYGDLLERQGDRFDPRVSMRILAHRDRKPGDHAHLLWQRERMRPEFWRAIQPFEVVLAPTVPILPPRIDDLAIDAAYLEANARCLRNTQIFNFLGGPAVTVPCDETPEGLSIGLMVATSPYEETLGLRVAALVESKAR